MLRVVSALVLLPIVIGTIWWLPPIATLLLAEVVALAAFVEYASLAARLGVRFARVPTGAATAAACAAVAWPGSTEVVLMAATIVTAALIVGASPSDGDALRDVGGALLAPVYLGLPIGALVAVRQHHGPEALLLLLLTVMASDTAQYYGGRAFGRRLLAPAISPKKTIEGAAAGFVAGLVTMPAIGRWWLPGVHPLILALVGVTVVALGIAGDLFESRLKRGAGVKDASALIPGHGGMLDRIDSLLLAGPFFYACLRYASPNP
jgi:phosphatidate cytidylyltransferase